MIFLGILIFIVAIALPSLQQKLSSILLIRISTIIMIYAGALSLNALYIQSIGSGIGIYSGFFQVTFISQFIDTFLLIIGSMILIARPINNIIFNPLTVKMISNENKINESSIETPSISIGGKYSLIILFSSLGSLLLISSADLISMYLSIELQSFGVYILATLYRESKLATSAGLKYFLLGGLSSCLILLGASLIYTFTGLTNLESIYLLNSIPDTKNITQGLTLGIILIIVGFLFKIAAAPLHHWAPDVYDDSPTIVTIWLQIMPKIAILIFLLELYMGAISYSNNTIFLNSNTFMQELYSMFNINYNNLVDFATNKPLLNFKVGDVLKNLLLLSSLFSLIIGTVLGLVQSRIKRLLAYSTVSHIGFILLALLVNTEQSIESFLFYIIQYSITNLNIFLIILALGYLLNTQFTIPFIRQNNNKNNTKTLYELNKDIDKDIRFISELKGQFIENPLLSLSLAICLFSMAGIPPLIGFFSKQMVLYSAIESGYYFICIVAILSSVISASYYLKIVRVLFSEKESKDHFLGNNEFKLTGEHIITNLHSILISTLTLSILFFILKPSILLNSTQLLSLTLYNF
jgi:NADH-ubiquinone oxidoreductase chain 2